MSAADAVDPVGSRVPDTTGLSRAAGGKSHSNVTPHSWSPSPSANTISVADGSSDTIRTPAIVESPSSPHDRDVVVAGGTVPPHDAAAAALVHDDERVALVQHRHGTHR